MVMDFSFERVSLGVEPMSFVCFWARTTSFEPGQT